MLTENEQKLIRIMVAETPTVENMTRVSSLSDEDVRTELSAWVQHRLAMLRIQLASYQSLIDNTTQTITLMEEFDVASRNQGEAVGTGGSEGTVGDGVSEPSPEVSGSPEEGTGN